MVEHRNYLGREVSATLKPWVDLGRLAAGGQVPEPIAACLKKMDVNADVGELPLGIDAFKLSLETNCWRRGSSWCTPAFPRKSL